MMTAEAPSIVVEGGRPDVHVWMTPEEAAETLATSVSDIDRRLDEGDLESRVAEDGALQVLVCLPKRTTPATAVVVPRLARPAAPAQSLMPLARAMSWAQADRVREAERSARRGWTAAAAMLLAAGVAGYFAWNTNPPAAATQITATPDLSGQLADASASVSSLSAERDTLRAQVAHANQKLAKVEAELVVDRNVEETLIKAALAARAAKESQPKSPVFADSSN